jgi:hypothetical protein
LSFYWVIRNIGKLKGQMMQNYSCEKQTQTYARLAGFMYLFVLATYIIGSQITSSFSSDEGFSIVSNNIKSAETLYRIGLSIELIASLSTVLLGGAFYALLKTTRPNLALFALLWRTAEAIFGGIAVAISFAALQNYIGSSVSFSIDDRMVLASLLSSAKSAIFYISVSFFSVGSSIFFTLLYHSKLLPKLMSAFGIFASILAGFLVFISLISPTLSQNLVYAWGPIFIIEAITGLWLLFRGVNLSKGHL